MKAVEGEGANPVLAPLRLALLDAVANGNVQKGGRSRVGLGLATAKDLLRRRPVASGLAATLVRVYSSLLPQCIRPASHSR